MHQVQGKIVTMSGNGVFMRLPSQLPANTSISLTVILPPENARIPLKILCQARVVGQKEGVTYPFGIGAIIDDYQIRPVRQPA